MREYRNIIPFSRCLAIVRLCQRWYYITLFIANNKYYISTFYKLRVFIAPFIQIHLSINCLFEIYLTSIIYKTIWPSLNYSYDHLKLLKSLGDHLEIIPKSLLCYTVNFLNCLNVFLILEFQFIVIFIIIHLQRWNSVYVSYSKFLNYLYVVLKKKKNLLINVDQHIFIW